MATIGEFTAPHKRDFALSLIVLTTTVAIAVCSVQPWTVVEKIRPNEQGVLAPPLTRSLSDLYPIPGFVMHCAVVLALIGAGWWVYSRLYQTEAHEKAKLLVVASLAGLVGWLGIGGDIEPAFGLGNWSFDGLSAVSLSDRTRTVHLVAAVLAVWLSILGFLVASAASILGARDDKQAVSGAVHMAIFAALIGVALLVLAVIALSFIAIVISGGGN